MKIECAGMNESEFPDIRVYAGSLTKRQALHHCSLYFTENANVLKRRIVTMSDGINFNAEIRMGLSLAKKFRANLVFLDENKHYYTSLTHFEVMSAMQGDEPTEAEIRQVARKPYDDDQSNSIQFY